MKYHVAIFANYANNTGQKDYLQEFRAISPETRILIASHFTECTEFNLYTTPLPWKLINTIRFVEAKTGYHATQRAVEWQKFGYDKCWITQPAKADTKENV